MSFEKYLDRQEDEQRNQNLARYFKISVDELNQIFQGDIEPDILSDNFLNGYFIYFTNDAPKEITRKIDGFIEDSNVVWVPTSVAFGQDDAAAN